MSPFGSQPGEEDKSRAPTICIVQKVEEPQDRETDDHCGRVELFMAGEMWVDSFEQGCHCKENDEGVAEVGETEKECRTLWSLCCE
jgi:hypothetical protein